MRTLEKPATIIRRVLGLVFGNNFTLPALKMLERYPYIGALIS